MDIDFNNAHPTILLKLLSELHGDEVLEKYPMIQLYCEYPNQWREYVARYEDITLVEAK